MYLPSSIHRCDVIEKWLRIKFPLFIILVCHTQFLEAARLPSAKRECAVCHIMWLTDFKRTDVQTLIPYNPTPDVEGGKTDIVSTQRMCFSCHDGFIQDSRFMWKKGSHAHPVGVKPSDKVTIPLVEGKEFFPLNDDGNLYCGSCHTAHGVDWEEAGTAVFMRMKNEKGQMCLACHDKKEGGTKIGSHPVFDKKLKDPPKSLIKAGMRLDTDGNLLCQSCHRPHGAADKKMLVLPNDRSQFCGACHTDQYASDKEVASHKGTHPINVSTDKVRIPEALKKSGAKVGENGEIMCQTCHSPHDAVPETPILVKANDQSSLCKTCHEDQAIVADGKHDMRLVDAASQNIRKQSVKEGGVCSACHLAHKGNGPKMWARILDDKQEPMAALCESCHRSKGLASKSRVGTHSHPVGVKYKHTKDTTGLPTFDKAGTKQTNGSKGMVTCASCHDPHRWDPKNPQANAKPGDSSDSTNRFLRKANSNDSGLCRTCHGQQASVRNSKHNLELTAPRERNIRKQTTSRSGVCGGCHLVHNAAGPLLWARPVSTSKDKLSMLCMSCHESQGIAGEKGIGQHSHPVNVESDKLPVNIKTGRWTNQIDQKLLQSLPLYNKNGQRVQTNGMLGCSTCHDPHVWSPIGRTVHPEKIKKTEGGPNDSFLRIADKGESALCVNCHTDKQAISKSKHNLALLGIKDTQIEMKDHDGKSGICSSCHSPHNAKGSKLWIRNKGPGKGAIETLCTDCHQEGGNAEKKLIGNYNHPIGIKLSTSMKAGDLPVYAKDGKRIDQYNGVIDCSTCHDPHRWTADNTKSETTLDQKTEGDARNSFLRLTAAPSSQLCVACHQDKQSVIATDHDLRITGPTAKNRHGQNVSESGVCGQCHTPHRGYDSSILWARFWDEEEVTNGAEKRCRSCHSDGEVAERKIPTATKHPDNVNILSGTVRKALFDRSIPSLPVYDSKGKQTDVGMITCSSCHDPHRWDPARDEKGPGKNTEGDVRTSFLRINKTASIVCGDCHGPDSIFRYKYFHSKSTHKQEN